MSSVHQAGSFFRDFPDAGNFSLETSCLKPHPDVTSFVKTLALSTQCMLLLEHRSCYNYFYMPPSLLDWAPRRWGPCLTPFCISAFDTVPGASRACHECSMSDWPNNWMNKELTLIRVTMTTVRKVRINCCCRVFGGLSHIYLRDQKRLCAMEEIVGGLGEKVKGLGSTDW